MDEIKGQYRIIGYVDDLENAARLVKNKDLGQGLIDEINVVHDDIVEMEPLLVDEKDHNELQNAAEKLIDDIVNSCRRGDGKNAADCLATLKTKIAKLKEKLS